MSKDPVGKEPDLVEQAEVDESAQHDPSPDGFDDEPPLRKRSKREPAPSVANEHRPPWKALGAASLIVGVIVGVYFSGVGSPNQMPTMPSNHPAIAPTTIAIDQAKVDDLKAKVAANPQDEASIKALSEIYFKAEDYVNATEWQRRLVDLRPTDNDARLILGVAYFNQTKLDEAEQCWLRVTVDDPKNAMAFYDLGFLYLAKEPPQTEKSEAAWKKVIEIDPNSNLAKTASSHLSSLSTAKPTASMSPTPTR